MNHLSSLLMLTLFLLFFILAVISSASFSIQATKQADFQKAVELGSVTTGQIVDRRIGRNRICYVFFSYEIDGKPYLGQQEISKAHYEQLPDGMEVQLAYFPRAPKRAILIGEHSDNALEIRYRQMKYINIGASILFLIITLALTMFVLGIHI